MNEGQEKKITNGVINIKENISMPLKKFTCPYCGRPTTITDPNYYTGWNRIIIADSDKGNIGLLMEAITCPNTECEKLWLYVALTEAIFNRTSYNWKVGAVIQAWQLLPESEAKVLPDYIPPAIVNDYYESCRIRDLSPRASATLARRCLQGMIRDYWGIKKGKLKDEVDALENKVDSDTWGSIHAVRSVGNIGAHMEKDIDIMVDVEPEEAKLLIGLIEQLIDDWYITRNDRRKRAEDLKKLVQEKEKQKQNSDKVKIE